MKIIAHGAKATEKLEEGFKVMYDTVGITYSPAGQNVAFARQWGAPKVVHDGVTVAKEVQVPDELVQVGVDIIKTAAENQVAATGDGTTLTTILSYHLFTKGLTAIKDKNVNPMVLRKQVLKALPELLEEIKKLSQPVKTQEQIKHVALVSADDEELAQAVAEAVEKVGTNGLVTAELNKKQIVEVSYTEGMELDRGYGNHSVFVTNPEKMEAVLEDPSVLVLGRKVTLQEEIIPLVQVVIASGSKTLLVIGEISGDALMFLAGNKFKGNISVVVVPPPGYGDARKNNLDDIAVLTGSTVVTDEIGMSQGEFRQKFNKSWIGTTKKTISTKFTTNIIKYEESDFKQEADQKAIKSRNERIKERVTWLQKQKEESSSIYEKEQYQERLARLTTGMAVIKIGSKSELETNEKMERVKDAIPATQAAVDEGIVPGGGVALLRASKMFEGRELNDGEQLLYDVLQEPIREILKNSGEEEKSIARIVEEVNKKSGNFGYNVLTEKIEDLLKSGVIDPAKVIREAVENSVSVGTSALTTKCIIAIKRVEVNTNMQMA